MSCGIWFPNQGSNLGPLHWEHGVLATGSPRKSLKLHDSYQGCSFYYSVTLYFSDCLAYLKVLLSIKTQKEKWEEEKFGLIYLCLSGANLVPGTQQMFSEWKISWPGKALEPELNVRFPHTKSQDQGTPDILLPTPYPSPPPASRGRLGRNRNNRGPSLTQHSLIWVELQNYWITGYREGTKWLHQLELCKLRIWWPKFLQVILPTSFNNLLFIQNLLRYIYMIARFFFFY